MTPEQAWIQEKIQNEIENLLRLASRHKVAVAGFAFAADPPMIVNFGNCTDAHTLRLYEMLVKMCEDRRAKGDVKETIVGEVN